MGQTKHKTRQHDLRASSIQKSMTKVGTILPLSTETLPQLRRKNLPEVDKLVKLNTDASALLGFKSCEPSLRRCDAIKPTLHNDLSSLCASHVPETSLLFGDNLQSRLLNHIRASNKTSKTAFRERHYQGKAGRFSNNNNAISDNRQRRGQSLLSKGRYWRQYPPKSFPQLKTNSQKRGNQGN